MPHIASRWGHAFTGRDDKQNNIRVDLIYARKQLQHYQGRLKRGKRKTRLQHDSVPLKFQVARLMVAKTVSEEMYPLHSPHPPCYNHDYKVLEAPS